MYPFWKLGNPLHWAAATLALLFAGAGSALIPAIALADPGENAAMPNPHLLAALVAVGGGPTNFSAMRFRQNLANSDEEAALRRTYGLASVRRFDDVFTFGVHDALSTMKRGGVALSSPIPNPANRQAVAKALFEAGLHEGKFNIERLFDTLFSQNVHMHAMMAVGQKYGASGESAYHHVFSRLVTDVGGAGKLVNITTDAPMGGMNMKGH
jgi:hypothetical protein